MEKEPVWTEEDEHDRMRARWPEEPKREKTDLEEHGTWYGQL